MANDISVSQPEIASAILSELERQGVKDLTARCLDLVFEHATAISVAAGVAPVYAAPDMGLSAWLASDDGGQSSYFMVYAITGHDGRTSNRGGVDYPHDPGDFGRCARLLTAVPEFRTQLDKVVAKGGPVWAGLVGVWDELNDLYVAEYPSGAAPRLFKRMQEIINSAR